MSARDLSPAASLAIGFRTWAASLSLFIVRGIWELNSGSHAFRAVPEELANALIDVSSPGPSEDSEAGNQTETQQETKAHEVKPLAGPRSHTQQ